MRYNVAVKLEYEIYKIMSIRSLEYSRTGVACRNQSAVKRLSVITYVL